MKLVLVCILVAAALYLIFRRRQTADADTGEDPSAAATPINPVDPVSQQQTAQPVSGRYVRLARTSGSDYINIGGMWVYSTREFGSHLTPTVGTVSPEHAPGTYPVAKLWDGNPDTFVVTENTANAYIELDFGSNKPIYRVKIENRRDDVRERIIGTTLIVYDEARREVARFPIDSLYKDYHIWVSPPSIDLTLSTKF